MTSTLLLMYRFCLLQVNFGFKNIEVFTFGQPRVGNFAFLVYCNEYVPLTIRVTHAHDLVLHLPPYYPLVGQKTYHHFATEVLQEPSLIVFSEMECVLEVVHVDKREDFYSKLEACLNEINLWTRLCSNDNA